ncbi:RNA polymerase III subunit RPC82-domain-containing protein [Choanephora cucurbitarum]|nr:RNA polymerase III subunit RPC82-domain-containing protein [Choanephora cucurbitarum]
MSFQSRLCKEILLEDFGPFVSQVGRQMLLKGRLTLMDIARFTKFPPKQVRECLVVLIQHGITFFSESPEGKNEPTYYSTDAERILMRLRMGSILREIEEQFGPEACMICKLLFANGRMTILQVKKWVEKNEGFSKIDKYVKPFTKLVASHYIKAVMPEHSRSTMDRYLAATEKESEKYTIMTSKELASIKTAAKAQVEAEYGSVETVGMKRKVLDPLDYQRKRAAIDHFADGLDQVEDEQENEVDEKVYFSVNYDKFNMIFRNDSIVDFATERINRTAGEIVKAFLEFGKDKMKSLKENDSPSATPIHIANMVAKTDISTRGDISLPKDPLEPKKGPSLQEVVRGYITLLKTDPAGFVKSKDERGANQFAVNFEKLRFTMKRKMIEGLVRERYGVATCRIMRILIERGKLDESQVQKLAMLPPKDTREKLALLKTKGFCEIQEIPRSADRAPSRCFHLWYVPLEKCYQELLVDAYRAICNLQQRKEYELSIRKRLIDKVNRKDVVENPDLLSESEKKEIANMDKIVERLEVAKSRIDTLIMILRDF